LQNKQGCNFFASQCRITTRTAAPVGDGLAAVHKLLATRRRLNSWSSQRNQRLAACKGICFMPNSHGWAAAKQSKAMPAEIYENTTHMLAIWADCRNSVASIALSNIFVFRSTLLSTVNTLHTFDFLCPFLPRVSTRLCYYGKSSVPLSLTSMYQANNIVLIVLKIITGKCDLWSSLTGGNEASICSNGIIPRISGETICCWGHILETS